MSEKVVMMIIYNYNGNDIFKWCFNKIQKHKVSMMDPKEYKRFVLNEVSVLNGFLQCARINIDYYNYEYNGNIIEMIR